MTARARELAEPIGEILASTRRVVAAAEPFDPGRSDRRFTIGAPDGVSAVLLPNLVADLHGLAPRIDISVRQLSPAPGARSFERAWEIVLAELDARVIDIAVVPFGGIPARFVARTLYKEDFVVAMRAGHKFAKDPTLQRFCAMQHLLVTLTGDAFGFVDDALAKRGLSRRIALTVPNFTMALGLIAETDLIAALPRRLVVMQAARFGLTSVEIPVPLRFDPIRAVTSKAAMMDAGVAWLFNLLRQTSGGSAT